MRETFYVTGGNLRADSPSYVERPADRELWEALCAGEYCYLLTSRQMGKSSLMVRTAARLKQAGCRVAVLDLTAVGQNLTPEQWYEGLLLHLGQQLDCEDELEEFWLAHDRLGPCQRFFEALRQVALKKAVGCRLSAVSGEGDASFTDSRQPTADSPRIVVFVDEVDVVQSLPFSTDEFFAAIRECFTGRAREPELERLVFCLLGVATPSDLIRDTRLTPFNIGQRIELTDFTEAEAAPLAAGLVGGVDFTTETRRSTRREEGSGSLGDAAAGAVLDGRSSVPHPASLSSDRGSQGSPGASRFLSVRFSVSPCLRGELFRSEPRRPSVRRSVPLVERPRAG